MKRYKSLNRMMWDISGWRMRIRWFSRQFCKWVKHKLEVKDDQRRHKQSNIPNKG